MDSTSLTTAPREQGLEIEMTGTEKQIDFAASIQERVVADWTKLAANFTVVADEFERDGDLDDLPGIDALIAQASDYIGQKLAAIVTADDASKILDSQRAELRTAFCNGALPGRGTAMQHRIEEICAIAMFRRA